MIDLLNWFLCNHMDIAFFLVILFLVFLVILGIFILIIGRDGKLLDPPENED